MKNVDYRELPEWSRKNDLWVYEGDGKFTFVANAISENSTKNDTLSVKIILALVGIALSSLGCFLIGTAFGFNALKVLCLISGVLLLGGMFVIINKLTNN